MKSIALRAGFLTTVQDLGRAGFREFGVSLGGALDGFGLRVANLLVGNDQSQAGLEVTLGGLELRFVDQRVIAWCGGSFDVSIDSATIPAGHAALVPAGAQMKIGPATLGCRAWLAISGGIDLPLVLRSRSTDLRARFGGIDGRALRDGDELPLGTNSRSTLGLIRNLQSAKIANWKPPHDWSNPAKGDPVLRFIRGNHWNLLAASSRDIFSRDHFLVSVDSDRMGVRFEQPVLQNSNAANLTSEAVAPGTIQVPPGGASILLLGDCQTIGGYPKIGHVITVDLPIAAQLRPADHVSFRETSLSEAHRILVERQNQFEQFSRGVAPHFQ